MYNNKNKDTFFPEKNNISLIKFSRPGLPVLNVAARWGALDTVEQLLKPSSSIDKKKYYGLINTKDKSGFTPLIAAAKEGNLEVVRALLKAAATYLSHEDYFSFLNTSNHYGFTALNSAAKQGAVKVVLALVQEAAKHLNYDEYKAFLVEPNKNGFTPLNAAAKEGNQDVVLAILDEAQAKKLNDEDYKALLTTQNQDGFTPLNSAAQENKQAVVIALLDRADKMLSKKDYQQLLLIPNRFHYTPLYNAAYVASELNAGTASILLQTGGALFANDPAGLKRFLGVVDNQYNSLMYQISQSFNMSLLTLYLNYLQEAFGGEPAEYRQFLDEQYKKIQQKMEANNKPTSNGAKILELIDTSYKQGPKASISTERHALVPVASSILTQKANKPDQDQNIILQQLCTSSCSKPSDLLANNQSMNDMSLEVPALELPVIKAPIIAKPKIIFHDLHEYRKNTKLISKPKPGNSHFIFMVPITGEKGENTLNEIVIMLEQALVTQQAQGTLILGLNRQDNIDNRKSIQDLTQTFTKSSRPTTNLNIILTTFTWEVLHVDQHKKEMIVPYGSIRNKLMTIAAQTAFKHNTTDELICCGFDADILINKDTLMKIKAATESLGSLYCVYSGIKTIAYIKEASQLDKNLREALGPYAYLTEQCYFFKQGALNQVFKLIEQHASYNSESHGNHSNHVNHVNHESYDVPFNLFAAEGRGFFKYLKSMGYECKTIMTNEHEAPISIRPPKEWKYLQEQTKKASTLTLKEFVKTLCSLPYSCANMKNFVMEFAYVSDQWRKAPVLLQLARLIYISALVKRGIVSPTQALSWVELVFDILKEPKEPKKPIAIPQNLTQFITLEQFATIKAELLTFKKQKLTDYKKPGDKHIDMETTFKTYYLWARVSIHAFFNIAVYTDQIRSGLFKQQKAELTPDFVGLVRSRTKVPSKNFFGDDYYLYYQEQRGIYFTDTNCTQINHTPDHNHNNPRSKEDYTPVEITRREFLRRTDRKKTQEQPFEVMMFSGKKINSTGFYALIKAQKIKANAMIVMPKNKKYMLWKNNELIKTTNGDIAQYSLKKKQEAILEKALQIALLSNNLSFEEEHQTALKPIALTKKELRTLKTILINDYQLCHTIMIEQTKTITYKKKPALQTQDQKDKADAESRARAHSFFAGSTKKIKTEAATKKTPTNAALTKDSTNSLDSPGSAVVCSKVGPKPNL